jgi:hypothetical protein
LPKAVAVVVLVVQLELLRLAQAVLVVAQAQTTMVVLLVTHSRGTLADLPQVLELVAVAVGLAQLVKMQ